MTIIQVENLSKSYGQRPVLEGIQFTVQDGEMFGIIGPNGSGKSTLLKLVSGAESVSTGRIQLAGKEIGHYSRKQLARWLAVLQQEPLPPIGFTVRQVVEMGRYPFQSWLGDEPIDQTPLIDSIMDKLGLHHLANRTLEDLSGGERQRVALGKVMAQQPSLLLLDEPTTFLDIGYQMQMMDYIHAWQRESNLTVIAVLHDLNLASQFCDRILVLHEGRIQRIGTPSEVLDQELLAYVYGTKPIVLSHPVSNRPQVLLQPKRYEPN